MTLTNGIYSATIASLTEGDYQYKFLLNNRNWDQSILDPLNPNPQSDGNSTFHIGAADPIAESPIIEPRITRSPSNSAGKADRVRVAGTFTSWG